MNPRTWLLTLWTAWCVLSAVVTARSAETPPRPAKPEVWPGAGPGARPASSHWKAQ